MRKENAVGKIRIYSSSIVLEANPVDIIHPFQNNFNPQRHAWPGSLEGVEDDVGKHPAQELRISHDRNFTMGMFEGDGSRLAVEVDNPSQQRYKFEFLDIRYRHFGKRTERRRDIIE